MSNLKSFILGMLIVITSMGMANASYSSKGVTRADATAYAKIDKYILEAERKTGVQAELLSAIAFKESNFGNNVRSKYSSAKGVMQYTNRQWNHDRKVHAKKLGLSAKSDVHNKRANILIGAAGLAENRSYLETRTKRPINDGDLYMSWFVGLYGAERIIKGNPNAKISKYISITKGNYSLLTVNGKIATVSQFRSKMNGMINGHKKQVSRLVNQTKLDYLIANIQSGNNVPDHFAVLH